MAASFERSQVVRIGGIGVFIDATNSSGLTLIEWRLSAIAHSALRW
jgi:hypothetical protein